MAELEDRKTMIHEKGFDISSQKEEVNSLYGKIKINKKVLEDAILDLDTKKQVLNLWFNKADIYNYIFNLDLRQVRAISDKFYLISGIYQKVINAFASLYRYDWYIVPEIFNKKDIDNDKIINQMVKNLSYLENSNIKTLSHDIAFKVIKNGAYYGYIVDDKNGFQIQELPPDYCRSRFTVRGNPAVEFNMKFFDEQFTNTNYRLKILKMFPKEFSKGYILYKQQKLPSEEFGDGNGWYLLDPEYTVKISLNDQDLPLFVNAIPAIMDLDEAQALDRKKQMQQLLKLIIQKLPRDKNGDLIFDNDEALDIHRNAVRMLSKAIGVDILTTFADIESVNLSDKNTSTTLDDLEKVERTVFNDLGISQNLFNTNGNLSLEKSILNDEGSMKTLILQLSFLFDRILKKKNSSKTKFRFYMLETTQYNYKELSKMYKEQVQIGYSKMLPQIALGHSQNFILNTAIFENQVLKLSEVMIPPLMSSTMNIQDLSSITDKDPFEEENQGGRPEKPDDEKSDKTIQNRESMS